MSVWQLQGTIDPGDGSPGLGDSGHFWLFSHNCHVIGETTWNGGGGGISFDLTEGRGLSFNINNAPLSNGPSEPSNVQVNGHDVPYVGCGGKDSNSGFGYATYWRVCSMRWDPNEI